MTRPRTLRTTMRPIIRAFRREARRFRVAARAGARERSKTAFRMLSELPGGARQLVFRN
jgi:hypothetical protein